MDVDGDTWRGDYGSWKSMGKGHGQTDRNRVLCGLRIVNDCTESVCFFVSGAVAPQCGEMFNYDH